MKFSLTSSRTCRKNTKTGCKVLLPHFVLGTTHRSIIFARVDNNQNNTENYNHKIPPHFLLPLYTSSSIFSTKRLFFTERLQRSSSSAFAATTRWYSFSSHKAGRTMPRGKGGGASSSSSSKEVDISKSLSYLLRHGARKEGLVLDEGGWANVADVVGFIFFFSFWGFWGVGGLLGSLFTCCVYVCLLSEGFGLDGVVVCD